MTNPFRHSFRAWFHPPRSSRATTTAPTPSPSMGAAKRKRRQPAPPPRVDAEDGERGLDNLPDDVLRQIVSLLPTKEGGRTPILAARWRHIWRSAPLNLECHGLLRDDDTIDLGGDPGEHLGNVAITHILSIHQGPGRRLRVPAAYHMQPHRDDVLDGWLLSPALHNLQELDLYHRSDYDNLESVSAWPPPPLSATRFAPTLRVATFSHCEISDRSARSLHFPNLKMLAIEEAALSETSVEAVVTGCPLLENLLLRGNVGASRVRIVSQSIRSIAVHVSSLPGGPKPDAGGPDLEELIVEDAPCLERLLRTLPDRDLSVTVMNAPRLETLGCLTDTFGVTELKLGSVVILRLDDVKFTEAVRSVKILAFSNRRLSLDMVVNFMECFPCLERLYIKTEISGEENLWRRKHSGLIKRHDIRLKNLVLENYRGTNSQIHFATFFILNAKLLESMRFQVQSGVCTDGSWIKKEHRRLLVEKRASRCAKIDFKKYDCGCNFTHVESVHDLSVADPFACRCSI